MALKDKTTPENVDAKLDARAPVELKGVSGSKLFEFMASRGFSLADIGRTFGLTAASMKKYYDAKMAQKRRERAEQKDLLEKLDQL